MNTGSALVDKFGGEKNPRRRWRSIFILVLGLLFLASPAGAYWIQHTNQSLDPTLSPEQFWPAADGSRPTPGKPPLPITITILPLPPSWPEEVLAAVTRSVEKWKGVKGASLVITLKEPKPGEQYRRDWETRYEEDDGQNTIEFVVENWPWFWGPNVMGVTVPRLDESGRIREADIFLNAVNYRWQVFSREGSFPALAAQNRVDVEAVVTHELGHFFGLGHSQYPWASMFGVVGLADTRSRWLSPDDAQGLRALYPASESDLPPPSIWGVHEDNFPEGNCGKTLSLLSAQIAYVERGTPLPGPHEMIYDSTPEFHYCLFGSGFRAEFFQSMDLAVNGQPQNAVVAAELVSPNFVRAIIMNGSGGYPALPLGVYDLTVTNFPGTTGALEQGLFVNTFGNGVPEAVIQGVPAELRPRTWVKLDGSASLDPDLDPLTYRWTISEKPPAAPLVLSSDTAAVTYFFPPQPGIYVIRLVVNDGIIDSVADQVMLRASYSQSDRDPSPAFSPWGCALHSSLLKSEPGALTHDAEAKLDVVLVFIFILLSHLLFLRRG